MTKLLEVLAKLVEIAGVIVDLIKGPSVTMVYLGDAKHQVRSIQPSVGPEWVDVSVRCRQIIYHTHYHRPWVPDSKKAVYEVCGYAPDELKPYIDPRLFETVTYPLLCNPLLKWTTYPHIYAILAYLNRVVDSRETQKVSI